MYSKDFIVTINRTYALSHFLVLLFCFGDRASCILNGLNVHKDNL